MVQGDSRGCIIIVYMVQSDQGEWRYGTGISKRIEIWYRVIQVDGYVVQRDPTRGRAIGCSFFE